jgi:hypothetical protein
MLLWQFSGMTPRHRHKTTRSGSQPSTNRRDGRDDRTPNDAQGYGCFSFTSSSGAAHGKGSIFISEASSTRGPIPLGQK